MKRITLSFFLCLFSFIASSQINEGFEGATFPPTTPGNWTVMDNGVGTGISWTETTDPARVYAGAKAAIIDRENVGAGNTSQDFLITPQITLPANGQLRFFTRQTLVGNNGSTYEIRVSTTFNPSSPNIAAFSAAPIQTWTETTLNTTYNVYEEKTVNLSVYPAGTQVYIAFVKVNTQPAGTVSGDRWLIDEVRIVQQCLDPSALNVGPITPTTASLQWTNSGIATNWDVAVQAPGTGVPTGTGTATSTNPYIATGLTPSTAYEFYVRANCGSGNLSQWVGPFNFTTSPEGSICSVPIVIGALPYSHTANTNTYGDEFDTPQGTGCGATPSTTNYMQGSEVFYSFTPTFTGNISITMTPGAASSSLFVYNGCANVGVNCLGGVADTGSTPRVIPTFAVTAGQTYVIVISSSTTTTTGIPYTLVIQQVNCAPPAGLSASNIGTTTADLSWTNPSGATSWQVAVQPAGSPIPSGSGITANTNTNFGVTGLTAATAYQYWVRADCGGGLFSAWAGPFLFNTKICDVAQQCNYTFRLTDSYGDGWNGATMEVRQNGVAVATLGSTFTTGAGPVDIIVPLCDNYPFELYWTAAGGFPNEVGISVINNFTQTLYTKAAGTGAASTTTPLYSATFSCATPACLPPTNLTATAITTNGATLGWTSAGATAWDIYVVPNGSPAPGASTVPTYANVTTNPYTLSGLLPLTQYQFYVRVVCSGTSNSVWAGPFSFTTLPTCPQPTNLTVTGIGMNSANLGWTEAGTATQWEVFVVPNGSAVPAPGSGTVVNTNPYTFTGLTAATNYQFYVRAICSATDASTISGPIAFTTTICAPTNQCNYTFRLTDSYGDGWNGARMEVRQNGIVIATLGSTFTTGAGPIDITVPICHNIPFDLYWTTAGSFPSEVGISIIEPIGSTTIFTKPSGTGAASTTNPLYSDIGQCFPPTCGKPINLTATSITQTSAVLGWTQPATPGTATSWEIIVQPAILGYPTGPGVITTSNPYTVTGLTGGTAYEFYVRANCGSTDGLSVWAGPFAFSTPVANDDCINAIVVPVNNNASCALYGNGSVIGATASTPATTCAGTADDDVWFKFTATSNKHYINLFNVQGSTTDLNHVVYSGTCAALVQQGACQLNNSSIISGLTIGNTYYVRVYTATATTNQTTTFNICIGTVSSCESAQAFCSNPTDPFIFANTTGVPSEGAQACLGTNPNPTYYFMTVQQSGNLQFQLSQNTSFDAAGNPTGTGLDVDFVAWGPFTSNTAACGNLGNGCPAPSNCPNNTTNPTFYPYTPGNIMDCSYSAAAVENFTIPNAIAGQVYVVVITNFNGAAGFIKLTQTNFGQTGAGATDCSTVCSVDLGPDKNLCGVTSTILDSHVTNAAATFVWKRNGVVIPGATASTYTATQSGTYTCIVTCGPNDVQDTIIVNLGPNVVIPDLVPYALCDDASNDGIATFDLATITPTVLVGLNPAYTYTVTYYYNEADALAGNTNIINSSVPYVGASQTIYIRVVTNGSPLCNTVVPLNLVVKKFPIATISSSDADNIICGNESATITVTPTNFVVGDATYSWTLNGTTITGATTNVVTVTTTGTYECTINLNGCTNVYSLTFTVNPGPLATISSSDADNTICSTDSATITVTPTNFVVGDATYSWTLNGTTITGATTNVVTVTTSGTYECTINLNGCTSVYSLVFTVNPQPLATISSSDADNTICSSETATITVTPTNFAVGDATYSWTLNGTTITGATTNVVTVTTSGTYACTINLNGCTNVYSLAFTVNPQPLATISSSDADNTICSTDSATITVTPTNFAVGDATYSWTLNGTTITGATTNVVTVTTTGTYACTINLNGCTNVYSLLFTVNPQPVATISSSDADNTICSNETATITVTPTNFVVGDATYSWTLNGTTITGATTNVVTVTTTGTYVCTINLNGCITSLSQVFTVNFVPVFNLDVTNSIKCANETATIKVVPTNFSLTDPNITYTWRKDGSPLSFTTSFINVTEFGIYEVTVSNLGCSASKQTTISEDMTDILINTNGECNGTNYIITASPVNNSYNPQTTTYQWFNDNLGILISGATNSTFNVTKYIAENNIQTSSFPITFSVKITTTPDGCTDTQKITVESPFCVIPKGISPNGDGDNDNLDLRGLGVKQLNIFNRYGTKVYGLADYTNQWVGQSDNGQQLPDGTYYFVIEQKNGETKSGWIYINK